MMYACVWLEFPGVIMFLLCTRKQIGVGLAKKKKFSDLLVVVLLELIIFFIKKKYQAQFLGDMQLLSFQRGCFPEYPN